MKTTLRALAPDTLDNGYTAARAFAGAVEGNCCASPGAPAVSARLVANRTRAIFRVIVTLRLRPPEGRLAILDTERSGAREW